MKRILDIKTEEKGKVFNLFFQNFFDGLGTSFFYAMGLFIFLQNGTHHDALHYYPLVFVIGGLLILTISPIYRRVESIARTDHLLYGLGFFVILIVVLSYVLLKINVSLFTGITLLILFQLIYYLRQTQFWGLSALSFNVLQSRRLFSIVSAGDLPAKFLGYALVFKLLQSGTVQPEHLIYFSVLAYLISFVFLRRVFRSDHHLKHSSHEHFRSGVKEIKFFGNHLIKALAIMAFFIMFVVFVVDYSFTKVVMHKINSEDADMYLLVSTILYSSYGLASLIKLFITGRVFQYLGLRWTMVITPALMLILIISTLFLSIGSSDPNWWYVRLFIFLYIAFIIFRDVIGKPVFLTLFQPLSKKMRLHGHNIVKGIAEPLGMLISGGLLLIYFGYFDEYELDLFALALIIPILSWLFASINVRKTYNKMLQNVINLRLLSGKQFLLFDNRTNDILIEKLASDDEIEVLFALDHLKNHHLSAEHLIPLSKHGSINIQKAAWDLGAKILEPEEFNEMVSNHFSINSSTQLRHHVFYLLSGSATSTSQLTPYFLDEYPEIIEGMILGWAQHKRFELPEKVKEIINTYLESTKKEKYNTGLRLQKVLPSSLGRSYITKSLESSNTEQRKSAVIGSFGFVDQQFFNRIVHLMNEQALSRVIKDEFINLGDEGCKHYLPLLKDADDMNTIRLIQIMGKIGSENVLSKLVDLLRFKNPDLRKYVLDTILSLRHHNLKPYQDKLLQEYQKEISIGTKLLSTASHRSDEFSFIANEFRDVIRRILKLLSLLDDQKVIRRIEDGLFSGNSDHIANSIEALSQTIISELFNPLKHLLDGLIDPPVIQKNNENLASLLNDHARLNKWTAACLLARCNCTDIDVLESLKKRNAAIINELIQPSTMETPDVLRTMEKVIMLRKTSLFSNTPENVLVEIAGLLTEESYEPNATIFNKGDIGDCMYIIYSGKVKVHDSESLLAKFGERSFFGDLAMLDTEPRSATATAIVESVLLRLDQEAIYELMDDRIEVAQSIIRTLCSRIRNLNAKYVEIEGK